MYFTDFFIVYWHHPIISYPHLLDSSNLQQLLTALPLGLVLSQSPVPQDCSRKRLYGHHFRSY